MAGGDADAPGHGGQRGAGAQRAGVERLPDLAFDRSLNPYRGCEHGCIYCYARPSHAYWDMSPGIDFETRLIARSGLVDRLREEFCKRSYVCRPIAFSGNTDCYQPLEAERGTSREILGFLLECRHPVSIITKSALILRDLDLLGELARRRLVRVSISLISLDTELKRSLEPRAASPPRACAPCSGCTRPASRWG